jgi:hypothetical protein
MHVVLKLSHIVINDRLQSQWPSSTCSQASFCLRCWYVDRLISSVLGSHLFSPEGADYDMSQCSPGDLDPHAVASIFKAYLRERQ